MTLPPPSEFSMAAVRASSAEIAVRCSAIRIESGVSRFCSLGRNRPNLRNLGALLSPHSGKASLELVGRDLVALIDD